MQHSAQQPEIPWSTGRLLRQSALPLAAGIGCGVLAIIAAGPTLGAFFATVALVTLLTPGIAMSARHWGDGLIRVAALCDGAGLACLAMITLADLHFTQWLQAYVTLVALAALLAGLAQACRRLHASAGLASGIATSLGILWLSCPIWLFHHLTRLGIERPIHAIIAVHPLFVLNGVLRLGNWTEMGMAYHLLQLNQDLPISLPQTIWAGVALHGILAAVLLALTCRNTSPTN